MAYYRRSYRGRKINGQRNDSTTHCRWCKRTLLPGQGLTWVDPGGYQHAKCACGCNASLPEIYRQPEALQRVCRVDVVNPDGSVVAGYLLSDGSVAKLG